MSKLRVLARKCAALPTLLHFLVHLKCSSLGRKCSTSAALFSSMVRRISRLKIPIYRSSKCSSVGSFPNFAQTKNDLREESGISPVNDELIPYVAENHDANTYPADEFDRDNFEEWLESLPDDFFIDIEDDPPPRSWSQRAVDEAIAEEGENNIPHSDIGEIPF